MVKPHTNYSLHFDIGQPLRWNLGLLNAGRSPATDVVTDASVWFGETALKDVDKFFSRLPENRSGNAIIMPYQGGSDLDNSPGFDFSSFMSKNPLDDASFNFLQHTDGGVVVAGRIWYRDASGNQYWTDFCRMTLQTRAIEKCLTHNGIH